MNAKIKKAWINALRSKKYKKCTGQLKIKNGFCVLGVLCELFRLYTGGDSYWESSVFYAERGGSHNFVLPQGVVDWAELISPDPYLRYNGRWQTLSVLSDSGLEFGKLADLIEEQL